MDYKTKWGEFIGTEEDYKSFVEEMERREKSTVTNDEPVQEEKPVKKTRAKK